MDPTPSSTPPSRRIATYARHPWPLPPVATRMRASDVEVRLLSTETPLAVRPQKSLRQHNLGETFVIEVHWPSQWI